MFVTQAEIEARLKSDANLLALLNKKDEDELESDSRRSETRESTDVDDDVKLERILDLATSSRPELQERTRSGRPNGAINRSTEQRADIALMGTVLGHTLAGSLLGVSTASPSLHSRGLINEGYEDLDLAKVVKRKLNKIRDKSATALIRVLDNADSNQMYEHIKTAKDAVFIANGLASVIQKVNPQEQDTKPTAQFVIIQPTVKTVEQYEVINV